MADNIEAKLNMSLDDLVKKGRQNHKHPAQQRDNHQAGSSHGKQQHGAAAAGHNGRPFRGEGSRASYQQPQQHRAIQQHQHWGQQQQQGGQWGGRGGPQRRNMQQQQGAGGRSSVFARLGGPAQAQQHPMQHNQQRGPPPREIKVQCRLDAATGEVVISHNSSDIIKVDPAGAVTLDSGGDRSAGMLDALNAGLEPLKIAVKASGPDPATAAWSVSDGRGLLRFQDGMAVPAKGHLTAGRAMVLLQAFSAGGSKAAAAAAQEASKQAAIAAGILPATAAGGAGAAAAAEGPDAAQIRRLKAQGRYQPY
ncbi:hypothetical protein COO60DRAFT_1528627 [Scenedesmus sp. NREL 46B-D3]|nr:hypothetical protein COO60DRAFT_1528627 [Scenedesmus sp. NREL 46B-D3]